MPGASLRLGSGALPQREGFEFYLVSKAGAQAEANRTGQAVPFIAVDQPLITDDTATILGGQFKSGHLWTVQNRPFTGSDPRPGLGFEVDQ